MTARVARSRRMPGRDRGSVSIMFAIGMIAVIMFISLSVDGGGQIRESQRANDFAAEAARAAGQMINLGAVIAGNPVQVDQNPNSIQNGQLPYQAAATGYLAMASVEDGVTFENIVVTLVNSTTVQVTLTIDYHAIMLGMFGFNNTLKANGSATAVLVVN